MEFFRETNFDFMGNRHIAIACSALAILVGIISLIIKGGPAYNIDFLGGTEVQVRFQQTEDIQKIREILASIGMPNAEIKAFDNAHEYVIRFQGEESGTATSDRIQAALQQAFPNNPPVIESVTNIGPRIGRELRESAIWAILVSLGVILVYISVRFEFLFAVGAVVALFHDVLITLGFFSIFNREFSLAVLGAFLTLIGYSLNDTIVVFDRIRENLKRSRRDRHQITPVINVSINSTLSRTILTSGTTLIVVIVCLFAGGEVLRDFFLCLLFGITVGTYSSIFIAAPVVATWYGHNNRAKVQGARPAVAER